jgi:hypothetical protein
MLGLGEVAGEEELVVGEPAPAGEVEAVGAGVDGDDAIVEDSRIEAAGSARRRRCRYRAGSKGPSRNT